MQVLTIANPLQCVECLAPLTQVKTDFKNDFVVYQCDRVCHSAFCPHENVMDCKFTCKNYGIQLEVPIIRLEVNVHVKGSGRDGGDDAQHTEKELPRVPDKPRLNLGGSPQD
jgi:hypothetical protein